MVYICCNNFLKKTKKNINSNSYYKKSYETNILNVSLSKRSIPQKGW